MTLVRTPGLDPGFISVLGSYYDAGPVVDQGAVELWTAYGYFACRRVAELGHELSITTSNVDPYDGDAHLLIEECDLGQYRAWTGIAPHPIWGETVNLACRTVHDIDGHWRSRGDFTWEGECAAIVEQARHTPVEFWPVIFSDTVLQLASTLSNHQFAPQKAFVPTTYGALVYAGLGGE